MKKKILIPIFVVLFLAVVGGGFFWWWQRREIKGSPQDYVIKETEEGKFVENKKAGLTVKVPEGWEAEKMEVEEGFVVLYPLYAPFERQNGRIKLPLEDGCIIDVGVVYEKMDFTDIKIDIRYTLSVLGINSHEFEEIIINDYSALKNIFDTQKIGPGIGINIPYKNRTHSFYLYWSPDKRETCIQEFDKFLETILIK